MSKNSLLANRTHLSHLLSLAYLSKPLPEWKERSQFVSWLQGSCTILFESRESSEESLLRLPFTLGQRTTSLMKPILVYTMDAILEAHSKYMCWDTRELSMSCDGAQKIVLLFHTSISFLAIDSKEYVPRHFSISPLFFNITYTHPATAIDTE
jgi:hypothetical protein